MRRASLMLVLLFVACDVEHVSGPTRPCNVDVTAPLFCQWPLERAPGRVTQEST